MDVLDLLRSFQSLLEKIQIILHYLESLSHLDHLNYKCLTIHFLVQDTIDFKALPNIRNCGLSSGRFSKGLIYPPFL